MLIRWLDKFKLFHKTHHTKFMLIESSICLLLMVLLSFLSRVYTIDLSTEETNSYISFHFDNFYLPFFLPVIFALVEIIGMLVIIFVRDKKGNPIKAKHMSHVFFYLCIGLSVGILILRYFFSSYKIANDTFLYHSYEYILCLVLNLIISIEVYVWRSEFGLEKLYDNSFPTEIK